MTRDTTIDSDLIDAVIFDLDGVITDSAEVHRDSWERLFNEFLRERSARTGESFRPFESSDYLEFIDGKPRYDGVNSFLASRDIELAWGSPEDGTDTETICGLGNRKDAYFLEHLRTQGVEPFATSVDLVRELQHQGVGTALISSSRNVQEVLAAADLEDLFPVIVDGVVAQEIGIPGKPDPAVFLEAAARLGAAPTRSVVVEDALSGVEAGNRGGFGLVIGVDRTGQADQLVDHGATTTVPDLGEVSVIPPTPNPRAELPSAANRIDEIVAGLEGKRPVVLLDYDGTLTPIVEHPDLAVLSEATRSVVAELSRTVTVAVLSGRDVSNVREKIGIGGIYYAGSHGLDIIGPDGEPVADESLGAFQGYVDSLDAAAGELEDRLGDVAGTFVERKRYAVAVHFRQSAEADRVTVQELVDKIAPEYPDLRVTAGKMIRELRPDLDWDKGRALDWLLLQLGRYGPDHPPFYLGDDTTDEDAFRVIRWRGVGILVGGDGPPTHARWSLADTDQVRQFLARMTELLK